MSQPAEQRNTIHILPNNSQSEGNQEMKFGQLIEYNKKKKLFKSLFLFSKKVLYEVIVSGPQLNFSIFRQPQLGKQ